MQPRPSPNPAAVPATVADALALDATLAAVSDSPHLDLQLLLAAALARPRTWLLAHPEHCLTAAEQAAFQGWLTRRQGGEPLAYITGVREFWSLPLHVTRDVLVPRPETELLVEIALQLLDGAPREVAEIGTGSGAIAIALATERPAWRIAATDISAAALQVARDNAARLLPAATATRFLQGDGCSPLATASFDLILSNPPYVVAGDPLLRDSSLAFEPPRALVGGSDGLEVIAALARGAMRALKPGGWLLCEHGCDQAVAVEQLLRRSGFGEIGLHQDLAGHPRATLARAATADGGTNSPAGEER